MSMNEQTHQNPVPRSLEYVIKLQQGFICNIVFTMKFSPFGVQHSRVDLNLGCSEPEFERYFYGLSSAHIFYMCMAPVVSKRNLQYLVLQ